MERVGEGFSIQVKEGQVIIYKRLTMLEYFVFTTIAISIVKWVVGLNAVTILLLFIFIAAMLFVKKARVIDYSNGKIFEHYIFFGIQVTRSSETIINKSNTVSFGYRYNEYRIDTDEEVYGFFLRENYDEIHLFSIGYRTTINKMKVFFDKKNIEFSPLRITASGL